MKISDFLQEKRVRFIEGEAHVIKPQLNEDIIFYNLDKARIKLINDEVIQKLNDKDTDETMAYKIFSYLIGLENDVDLETFINMIDNPPNNEFAIIVDEFIDSMENLFNRAETTTKAREKLNRLKEKLPEAPKTKEEIKNELLQELGTLQENTPENKKRRREIFQQLAELEE